ncbi:thiolase family protein [Variovorax sp. V116]|uniref:thiolase family protein n=1 Tax=Variovorax sp. V116 TaxID=3065953 RepID=UPI0034E8B1D6
MKLPLLSFRPVYVIGIGFHRYQALSATPYVNLGLTAAREALADSGLPWESVDSAFVATALLPMASGRPMLRHLGATGIPIVHIENASASGSAAFRAAVLDVASGVSDVSMVIGVDKPDPVRQSARAEAINGLDNLANDAIVPFTSFALRAEAYARSSRCQVADIALVAVKNLRNAAKNPYAQRQKEQTLEEVLAGKPVAGIFTKLQCTPVGEGGAAVIVASEEALKRISGPVRPVQVLSSAASSQCASGDPARHDVELTQATVKKALDQASVSVRELDVLEFHDAFTIEEIEYLEAIGYCGAGHAIPMLKEGAFDIGGGAAVSPSGGLIGMGHPIGPTGIGQIGEIVRQLRHEAGERQQPQARLAMAHMVGLGAVCYAHVLRRP